MMDVSAERAGFSPQRLERITEHLKRNYIGPGKIAGCQVTVARHGHIAYPGPSARWTASAASRCADDTIFRIYSMTKPITSVALMTLYEQGYFQLNDPVQPLRPVVEGPPRLGLRRGRRHGDRGAGPAGDASATCSATPAASPTAAACRASASQHPVDKVYRDLKVRSARRRRDAAGSSSTSWARCRCATSRATAWMYSLATDVCGALVEVISGQPFDAVPAGRRSSSRWA